MRDQSTRDKSTRAWADDPKPTAANARPFCHGAAVWCRPRLRPVAISALRLTQEPRFHAPHLVSMATRPAAVTLLAVVLAVCRPAAAQDGRVCMTMYEDDTCVTKRDSLSAGGRPKEVR